MCGSCGGGGVAITHHGKCLPKSVMREFIYSYANVSLTVRREARRAGGAVYRQAYQHDGEDQPGDDTRRAVDDGHGGGGVRHANAVTKHVRDGNGNQNADRPTQAQ